VAAVLVALSLGALLNGPGLVAAATALEVGPVRTVAVRMATLVDDTAALLRLDRPRVWLTDRREDGLALLGAADPDTDHTAPTAPSAPSATAGARPATAIEDLATEVPERDHDRTERPITAEDPLEVLLIGDSLIGTIADGFGRRAEGRETLSWTKDVRISTGLARPDVLDWHRHLERQLAVHDPDVVVLMLGGNDDQSHTGAPDGVIHLGQEGWEAEYERRVRELLAIAGQQGRLVVWLGLPAMRADRLERTRTPMRAAVERAVADTEVVLLDTEPIVSPGGYTARLDGVQVRADDGSHLTQDGGDLVAAALDGLLGEHLAWPSG